MYIVSLIYVPLPFQSVVTMALAQANYIFIEKTFPMEELKGCILADLAIGICPVIGLILIARDREAPVVNGNTYNLRPRKSDKNH